jgi:hypothetical protein
MSNLLDQISVNMQTGAIAYPRPEGFELDTEQVYRTANLFAAHCTTAEQAVRLAIHAQITAYQGARELLATRRG